VTAADVNAYIRDATGGPFSAKDLRTWAGTVLAHRAMRHPVPDAPTDHRRAAAAAVRVAADHLGNTPAVARSSYVHPAVLKSPSGGRPKRRTSAHAEDAPSPWPDLAEEAAVIRLLRREASGT
jgi:DNA topoisomerase-1